MDREKILKNLLSKTVERGCSKAEADNAKQMAEKKSAEWGIDLKAMERSLFLDGLSRRQRMQIDFADQMRRAAEPAQPPYHPNARCYTEPICSHWRRREIKDHPEAFKCKDCAYQSPYWVVWQKRNPKESKTSTYAGCTNPFGVHGRGQDPSGKWSSVAEFVMWHLKNTDLPFDEIALQSRMKFSGKTSKNSVAWYANKLKKQGVTIPERSK